MNEAYDYNTATREQALDVISRLFKGEFIDATNGTSLTLEAIVASHQHRFGLSAARDLLALAIAEQAKLVVAGERAVGAIATLMSRDLAPAGGAA